MLCFVTIVARRRTYWSLFLAACLCLAAFVPLFLRMGENLDVPNFLQKAGALGIFQLGTVSIFSYRLAAAAIGLCALYAALALAVVLFNFRKTASTEIFFYAFWVLSVGLEILRLVLYALVVDGGSLSLQILSAKALVFTRYAGYFSLFLSGLYAAGFHNEKIGTVAALCLAIAFALAASMPIDTGSFSSTLELRAGYVHLNLGLCIVASVVTIANFLYAAHATAEPAYRAAALGCAALLVGHHLLISVWNPYLIVVGFVLLVAGSALFVSRLHSYYLWQ
jgi:hypothetical protein